jgi:hypothetical protein
MVSRAQRDTAKETRAGVVVLQPNIIEPTEASQRVPLQDARVASLPARIRLLRQSGL